MIDRKDKKIRAREPADEPDRLGSLVRPWIPVITKKDGPAVEIGVWGRQYRFEDGPLPTSIRTADKDILAGPVRLVGKTKGQDLIWTSGGIMLQNADATQATLSGWASNDLLIADTTIRVEYDGMMRVDLTVIPHGINSGVATSPAPPIDNLWIEIPLRSELTSLYTHWPNIPTGVVQSANLENSGKIPENGLTLPFKPFIWLGWEDGGLTWFAESCKGWHPSDDQHMIEVKHESDVIVLRLHLFDNGVPAWQDRQETWSAPLMPQTFTFGLQATPVKPLPADFHEWRIYHLGELPEDAAARDEILNRLQKRGVRTLIVHEGWNRIQNYPATNPELVHIREMIESCHNRGMKLLLYFGYEFSTLAPEWATLSDQILVKNTQGGLVGGWDRQPAQRAFIVCYNSIWQEHFVAGIEKLVREYGLDGVYLDSTAIPWGCANFAHGCGYHNAAGAIQPTYPIFAVRRFMQRLYKIIDAHGGIINAHQSSCCCTPILAFAHSYWDGEQLGGNYENVSLPAFRAEFMGRNFGLPAEFLGPAESMRLTLLHNVRPRPAGLVNDEPILQTWEIMTQFEVAKAEWHAYWCNQDIVTVKPEKTVKVSFYLHRPTKNVQGRALMVVANLSRQVKTDAIISLLPGALGFTRNRIITKDALNGAIIDTDGETISLLLEPAGIRLLLVTETAE